MPYIVFNCCSYFQISPWEGGGGEEGKGQKAVPPRIPPLQSAKEVETKPYLHSDHAKRRLYKFVDLAGALWRGVYLPRTKDGSRRHLMVHSGGETPLEGATQRIKTEERWSGAALAKAKEKGIPFMSAEDLEKLNRQKKLVKEDGPEDAEAEAKEKVRETASGGGWQDLKDHMREAGSPPKALSRQYIGNHNRWGLLLLLLLLAPGGAAAKEELPGLDGAFRIGFAHLYGDLGKRILFQKIYFPFF